MIFTVTFNFPAHNGTFPGKVSTWDDYTLESAAYDIECEAWGDNDNDEYQSYFRGGIWLALNAVLKGLPVGGTFTITGDTHKGYYTEPVTISVTRTE